MFSMQTILGCICRVYSQSCCEILVVPKKQWQETKTTRLTFLYNYSSNQNVGGGLKDTEAGAVKHFTAIWIYLFRTIINSAFYKSVPRSRRAESLQWTESTRQNILWCDQTIPEPFGNATKHFIWQNQHHTNCEMRRQPHARRQIELKRPNSWEQPARWNFSFTSNV